MIMMQVLEFVFQVSNTPDGYVVQVRICGTWTSLRNFGDRQSNAKEFCYKDCPKLPDLRSIYTKCKQHPIK